MRQTCVHGNILTWVEDESSVVLNYLGTRGGRCMKRFGWIVFSLFVGATLWGQAAPSAVPAPTQNQAAVMSELQNRPMPTGWNSGRMQRSLRLMADLKGMPTKLDEMKANAAKVKDPAVKHRLQMENEMSAMMLAQL